MGYKVRATGAPHTLEYAAYIGKKKEKKKNKKENDHVEFRFESFFDFEFQSF